MSTTQKRCGKCNEMKNVGEFSADTAKKDGRVSQCKACRRAYRKKNAKALAAQAQVYKAKPESRYRTYKDSAKHRGMAWELTFPQFMKFWKKPCIWCNHGIVTIGLDRIDPSKPYTIKNVEPCCKHCNRMKSDLTSDEFMDQVFAIAANCGMVLT